MDDNLLEIKQAVYDVCNFKLTEFLVEAESELYKASRFCLDGKLILYRNAHITSKKIGQFVTCWKRIQEGPIEPIHEADQIDYYVITVRSDRQLGQFVFPRSVLLKKCIMSKASKEGKRAFRVYPPWDIPTSRQAERTQEWQLDFFFDMTKSTDFTKVKSLFQAV